MCDKERQQQQELLVILNEAYPAPVFPPALKQVFTDITDHQLAALAAHLDELGYVEAGIHISSDGKGRARLVRAKITARGRDYLKEDGGLTAERDTLTVRIHASSIREILTAQIERSEIESSAKEKLIAQVKSLPVKALEEAVNKLAQEGLNRLPNAIDWLQRLILDAL